MYTPESEVIETCYVVTLLNRFGEVSTGFWHNAESLRSSLIWYKKSYTYKGAAISIMRMKIYIFFPSSRYVQGEKDILNVHSEYIDPVALRERGEEVVMYTHHEKPSTLVARIGEITETDFTGKTYEVIDLNPEQVDRLKAIKSKDTNASDDNA